MLGLAYEGVADELLVARALRSEEGAFRALYQRHASYVAGVAFRLMGNDAELDDIVQETFVDASKALAQLENPSLVRAWLVAIAVRRVRRCLAKRRRRWFLLASIAELAASVSDPEDRRAVDELYDALDHLPDDLRVPWVLNRVEQFSLPEVAKICETSLSTIKRRVAEAERRIDRRLSP